MPGWRNVNYVGRLTRVGVVDVLRQAKVGIVIDHPITNYVDAYSTKMFEYMACGIPFVASDFPMWVGIVDEAECGTTVDPYDTEGRRRGDQRLPGRSGTGRRHRRERGRQAILNDVQLEHRVRQAPAALQRTDLMLPDRILVLAPHTDDAELGCGGSIARWLEEGVDAPCRRCSRTAEQSLPDGSQPSRLRDECHASLDAMGIRRRTGSSSLPRADAVLPPPGGAGEDGGTGRRAPILDWILVPSGADLHQDHSTVYHEALTAFKHKTILGYELPWNHITFSASAFVTLERRHLDAKWQATHPVRLPTGTQSPLLHPRVHGVAGAGPAAFR